MLISLGQVALAQADYASARACYCESLAFFGATEDKYDYDWPFTRHRVFCKAGIALCLAGLAMEAAMQEQRERAARLYGAAHAVMPADARLSPLDRAHYDRTITAIGAQLDEVTFAEAWAAGRALTLEQAIAEALNR